MPTDAEQRLLKAAVTEFAECGLAGGRVARIAAGAGANKQLIYAYFGDKEGLFDAVLELVSEQLNEAVPLDPEDLPLWAVTLFDYVIGHPEVLRLVSWQLLERPEQVKANIERDYGPYVKGVVKAQREGRISKQFSGLDLIVLLSGLATSWYNAFAPLQRVPGNPAWDRRMIARHRSALHRAATALVTP